MRADAEVHAVYAVLGGLYRDLPDNPAGFRDVDEHRVEVVLPALENAHAAAQTVIPVLVAEGLRRSRSRTPGTLTRWWRRVTAMDDHGDTHAALVPRPGCTDAGPTAGQLEAARHHLSGQHRPR